MRICLLLCLWLSAFPSLAEPPTWRVDPVHTRIGIAVDHAGFSRSLATLSASDGWLWWDGQNPSTARVEIELEPGRLDFGDSRWNQAVHGRQLLDVQRHPRARFVSRQVLAQDDGSLRIEGELTLRGITAPVILQARLNGQRRHPMPPFRQTVGFSATGQLSRAAFGATAWADMVADSVELRIELEASRQRRSPDTAPSGIPLPDEDTLP